MQINDFLSDLSFILKNISDGQKIYNRLLNRSVSHNGNYKSNYAYVCKF